MRVPHSVSECLTATLGPSLGADQPEFRGAKTYLQHVSKGRYIRLQPQKLVSLLIAQSSKYLEHREGRTVSMADPARDEKIGTPDASNIRTQTHEEQKTEVLHVQNVALADATAKQRPSLWTRRMFQVNKPITYSGVLLTRSLALCNSHSCNA